MDRMNRQEVFGEAHGKLILVGEHIVVYNKPAIAIPFPLKIRARISDHPGEVSVSSSIYSGSLYGMPESLTGIFNCIKGAFECCNKALEGVQIDVMSELPEGRGLGSSAASAAAIVRGIYRYFQKDLSQEELFSLVEPAETFAHGKPSGIDMVAVSGEEAILFQKPRQVSSLPAPSTFHIVVADTGIAGDTKKAVEHVKKLILQRPHRIELIMNQIEDIVMDAKQAILEGDSELLGSLLLNNHEKLKELEVSDPMLDHLVEAAMSCGALGAKLTGAGMGGCMIALTRDISNAEMISEKLMKEGAKLVWYYSTDSNRIYRRDAL